ncbi:carboxypeptidase regulatory-like domain-containing protein [Cryobacterium frigoriphilum]|uniref:Carboxypeptidase regulatory-like domain-containing protein n=1 Tax=Cryobacterium frigoriphilum TaxID=1259150 RepID=A0A4R8ZZL8_9MICO|nr:carboxypeptidase regulatory-like domain-containing protein [Cryobacterium frigoriphilum]
MRSHRSEIGERWFVVAAVGVICVATLTGCVVKPNLGQIDGTVTAASGLPATGCGITMVVISGGPVPELAAVTSAAGTFSWPVPPGRYEVTASCDGVPIHASVDVVADETVAVDMAE